MKPLAVPLTSLQIDAANELYRNHMPLWQATDSAFVELAVCHPGFDLPASLLKASAINQLYRAGVKSIHVPRMAQHISRMMTENVQITLDLVACVAKLPKEDGTGFHNYIVFASKFAHFFIDSAAYPIYDSYALRTVSYHLYGIDSPGQPLYETHVARLTDLRVRAGLFCAHAELDRYLWLSGEYRDWKQNRYAGIDPEARRLFATPPSDAKEALRLLHCAPLE